MDKELEKDYSLVVELIKKKMQECAEALAEAGKLATSINEDLVEMYYKEEDDEYGESASLPLLREMKKLGWSTSSLSC